MRDILECYQVLEIEAGAPAERVRKSYLEMIAVWDPDKHLGNPLLRSKAAEKREEIEEAYKAISHFLPELRPDYEPQRYVPKQNRDFKEMARQSPPEYSKTLFTILFGTVFLALFGWAYSIYRQTRTLPKQQTPIVDPDTTASSSPMETSVSSASTVP